MIHTDYYHPGFQGSFSINQVRPVVVPDLSYDGLEIREGSQAALAFIDMTDPSEPPANRERLRHGLLNARKELPHIPPELYPGQALSVELYRAGGIRSVEIGSVMFGKYDASGKLIPARMELVRLAIPRRVYTQSHIDYVVRSDTIEVHRRRGEMRGYRIVQEAPMLRHFTAHIEPV